MPDDANELDAFLQGLPPGPVDCLPDLERSLVQCWRSFAGSRDGGMSPEKLLNRIENAHWVRPVLSFQIERHGGTVLGSTRGELQTWEVDISKWTARMTRTGHRQLRPMAKRVDVTPLATEICGLIVEHREDPRLKWVDTHRVRVQIGSIIPAIGFNQTITGRRKRFKAKLAELLSPAGWQASFKPNEYERAP